MSTPPGDLFVFTRGEGDSQRSYSYPQHEAKALAAQLGMDLHSDADLLWFLKEALVTILPESHDADGRRVICYPGDPRHSVSTRALPGPTRLVWRNQRFEPEGGLEALWAD